MIRRAWNIGNVIPNSSIQGVNVFNWLKLYSLIYTHMSFAFSRLTSLAIRFINDTYTTLPSCIWHHKSWACNLLVLYLFLYIDHFWSGLSSVCGYQMFTRHGFLFVSDIFFFLFSFLFISFLINYRSCTFWWFRFDFFKSTDHRSPVTEMTQFFTIYDNYVCLRKACGMALPSCRRNNILQLQA